MKLRAKLIITFILLSLFSINANRRQRRQSTVNGNPPIASAPAGATGCGVSTIKSRYKRVVGGESAKQKKWPWMAAILQLPEKKLICGGTLISDRHVLTSANCLLGRVFKASDLLIRLGKHILMTEDDDNQTDYRVAEIRPHEHFGQFKKNDNDIGILKLERPATLSELIWPVCLSPPDNDFVGQLGYITGWGFTSESKYSEVLQEVRIPVWNQTDCVAAYNKEKPFIVDYSSMMCIGSYAGGKDSCTGDIGGPFLIETRSNKWSVVGITSFGPLPCGDTSRPGVYTRVNKYLDWINANAIFD